MGIEQGCVVWKVKLTKGSPQSPEYGANDNETYAGNGRRQHARAGTQPDHINAHYD
jgi:hypothetical protein